MTLKFAPGRDGSAPGRPDSVPHSLLTGQFATLTGFRGICILWVVFTHLPVALPALLENPRERWGIGVDFFLAVSGFLVTRSLYQSDWQMRARGGALLATAREFLARRVSRIFPPYFFFLALIAGLALIVDHGLYERLLAIRDILPSFAFFFSDYTVPGAMDKVPVLLYITWSLAFQEQFYFVLLLFFLASRAWLARLLFAAGLFSLLMRFYLVSSYWPGLDSGAASHTAQIQMWLHLRFDALSWSCLAWIYYDELGALWATPARARVANAGVALALAAVLAAHSLLPRDFWLSTIYCFKGLVLALVIRAICQLEVGPKGVFARLLSRPGIGKIGVAAYEIYLLNAVVIAGVLRLKLHNPWLIVGLIYLLAVGLGRAGYEIVGKPSQKWLRGALSARRAEPALAVTVR